MNNDLILQKIQEMEGAVAEIRQTLSTINRTSLNQPIAPDPLFSYCTHVDKGMQSLLVMRYRELARQGVDALPDYRDVGFRSFSQHDEDGIILFLMAVIGAKSRTFVELGCGNGVENNTTNLAMYHAWHGLMVDGAEANIKMATNFFNHSADCRFFPPVIKQAWVEPDNVNDLIAGAGFEGEIDFFSLDLDGVDYWTWKAIACIEPRLVVVETPTIWGPDEARTVPYERGFHASNPDYYGASLLAYVKLGREKGYRLVACNKYGTNAFFVKNGIADDTLKEIPPEHGFRHPRARHGVATRLPKVKDMPWVSV